MVRYWSTLTRELVAIKSTAPAGSGCHLPPKSILPSLHGWGVCGGMGPAWAMTKPQDSVSCSFFKARFSSAACS